MPTANRHSTTMNNPVSFNEYTCVPGKSSMFATQKTQEGTGGSSGTPQFGLKPVVPPRSGTILIPLISVHKVSNQGQIYITRKKFLDCRTPSNSFPLLFTPVVNHSFWNFARIQIKLRYIIHLKALKAAWVLVSPICAGCSWLCKLQEKFFWAVSQTMVAFGPCLYDSAFENNIYPNSDPCYLCYYCMLSVLIFNFFMHVQIGEQ